MARFWAACVAGAVLWACGATRAEGDERERPRISVSGTGKISAAPDVADINVGVVTQGNTAREALSANNEAMASLHQVLKQRGVAAKDIQTSQITVSPRYSQPPMNQPPNVAFTPRIVGYEVVNSVQVTARDIPRMGALLDAVVQAGANQIYGINFRIDEPEKLLDEARKRAVAAAKRKAELYAGEANVVLGPPIRVVEEGTALPQQYQQFGQAPMMAKMDAAVPVAPGQQELTVTVRVDYELRQPQ
jgi:uncharacterized protein YggE